VPRSEFEGLTRHRSKFFDRTEHLARISHHVDLLRADPRHLRVFEIDGLGGVGKSRLLNEVRERLATSKQRGYVCWVALEAEGFATETGPLLAVREQVDFDCLLFDTALVAYWHAIGQPFHIGTTGRLSRSFVVKALDTGRAAAGIPVSLTFAADIFRMASQKTTKLRRYKKADFEGIDVLRLDPRALRIRLPHYLAMDIRRRLEPSGKPFLAFYDAYDRQSQAAINDHARWLREFIATLDRGVHLITTREPIGWVMDDWPSVLDRIALGTLPDVECRQMIRERIGDTSPEIEDRIVEASRHIPFFLEMALDAYEVGSRAGTLTADQLPRTPDDAVNHLMDHLPDGHQSLAVALATVQTFDAGLYAYLVRSLNLPVSVIEFDRFLEWFFVERLSESLYKVHDLMTDFVYESAAYDRARRAALENCVRYMHAISEGATPDSPILPFYRSVVAGWRRMGGIDTETIERLIDVGYVLYDMGYWYELEAIAGETAGSDDAVEAAAAFFGALSARRTHGVDGALELLGRLERHANLLGSHELSLRLEVAYLSELAGNYAKAREEFKVLDSPRDRLTSGNRTQVRARLHHADVLMMDGDFVESSRMLLDALEQVGAETPLLWAELVRQRGHAFRFSYSFAEAEALYLQAIATSAGSGAMLARLHTNLAETYCWSEPRRAVEAVSLAYELNARLGNRIELAKCDAAKAITFARLGEAVAAREAALSARIDAATAGYPAGVAFAVQAAAIVHTLSGDAAAAARSRLELADIVAALGTYAHLRVVPAWLAGSRDEFTEAAAPATWIDAAELEQRLQRWVGADSITRP
jgi:hypothetical protein